MQHCPRAFAIPLLHLQVAANDCCDPMFDKGSGGKAQEKDQEGPAMETTLKQGTRVCEGTSNYDKQREREREKANLTRKISPAGRKAGLEMKFAGMPLTYFPLN